MTRRKNQMALDLRLRAASGREDFYVSASNADAVAWVDCWPDWPGPAVVLVGPPGSGKTHLGRVWQTRAGAIAFGKADSVDFANPPPKAAVLVDAADSVADDAALFHLFNAVAAAGGTMMFTARTAPARWTGRLSDLVSRLSAATTVAIQPPDEDLIAMVTMKMFADQRLDVDPDVLRYLVVRMERSFEAARALVAEINRTSLAERRPVTVPLVRELLERGGQAPDPDT